MPQYKVRLRCNVLEWLEHVVLAYDVCEALDEFCRVANIDSAELEDAEFSVEEEEEEWPQ